MSHKCHSVLFGLNGRPLAEIASVSADLKDGHVIPEHSHPEDQLLFASKGVMTLRTKQGVWVVPPLRAVWIPANTPHSVAMSGPVLMRTLYFLPRLCRKFPGKCFVMNVSSFLRELILHACKFKRLNKGASPERRIIEIIVEQLKAVDSFTTRIARASVGCARDASGEGAVGGSGRPKRPGKTLRGLRREQENDSARVSGGNEDEFWEVAAAVAAASWIAIDGFGRKSNGSGFGGGL